MNILPLSYYLRFGNELILSCNFFSRSFSFFSIFGKTYSLKIILPKGHTFTPKDIEENIGFSKDYNNFELRKAIGEKDQLKAYKIIFKT